ncbi:nucleoside diphosphate kinase 6-like [Xenia sp. Carnegie-2017]|uniref:nucleoside diphosphate kinase 6-like n=1 Tax=Xenia sp. Carnegie-2017 TaxID=2897299 RepID=UPI001F045E99|nr:nucleoside diphosphate kinase 6-like [Xenia sp. Carnegie-2017]
MLGVRYLQLTLAILKPDLISHPVHLKLVMEKILKENFFIVHWKLVQWSREDAERFYQEHRDKFFFQRLTSYMSSDLIMPMVMARVDAIQHWRKLMGPTKATMAKFSHPDSIRGLYGITDTRNATHGADSVETAKREIEFFFPEFKYDEWLEKNEEKIQNGQIIYDEVSKTHKVLE